MQNKLFEILFFLFFGKSSAAMRKSPPQGGFLM